MSNLDNVMPYVNISFPVGRQIDCADQPKFNHLLVNLTNWGGSIFMGIPRLV